MITQAADAGADAVKFQYYSTKDNKAFGNEHPPPKYTPAIYDVVKRAEIDLDDVKRLKEASDNAGIEFMATPFINPKKVAELDPYVNRWKIRERDNNNKEILYACLRTRKPTYRSQTQLDFDARVGMSDDLRQIFCVPKYPEGYDDVGRLLGPLDNMAAFEGYSNHIPHLAAVLLISPTPGREDTSGMWKPTSSYRVHIAFPASLE